MESPDAVEMRKSLQIVFHDLHHMRSTKTTFKMKMNHWIKYLTAGIKTFIDSNIIRDLPISAKIVLLEKEFNTDRLHYVKRCIVSII
jgi:hypothetical protein